MINLPESLDPIINDLIKKEYRPVVVGGFIRDSLLQISSKDIDIEVFGIESLAHLEKLLASYGKAHSVGKSFGVVKLQLDDTEVDFSVPRQEEKIAQGHKGFCVTLNGALSFEEAAVRRDFTINAMGYDLTTKELLDPFNGQADLENRRLDVVNAETFVEDPLRLYRAVQLAARFELHATPELHSLAHEMVQKKMLDELPKERIFEEVKKLLLKSEKPSIGFTLMDTLGMLEAFPELKALQGIPQDPDSHLEGDVWVHTLMVVDAMTRFYTDDNKKNLCLSLAALCHDLGKANATVESEGHISAMGHANSGVPLTESFLKRLSDEKALFECVLPLVRHHSEPKQLYKQGAKTVAIRRLASQVNIEMLVLLAKADFLGRTTKEAVRGEFEAGRWLLERAAALDVLTSPLKPLLKGRDLVAAGCTPSKRFKKILDQAYEAQLEGLIDNREDALRWLSEELKKVN
ncbi:MAG: HD domain-containing protein [Helicobacteraceae bacterium]|jgi:tRNA nucleotidyltransferase (CCA-adding enzyme)|nr:HD domain-containing protein [Helicobacteraceae bacterium]